MAVAASLVSTIVVSCLLACSPRSAPSPFEGAILPHAYDKPDLWLTDANGRRFNFRTETDGKVALVEFGYTHCPDVCPVTVSNIATALAKQPYDVANQVRVYFITQDPARDSAAVLRRWLGNFDPKFVGVVGPQTAVDSLARAFDVPPAAAAKTSATDTNYAVGHASQVIVFTRDNKAHLAYPFGVRQEAWTRDIPKLVALQSWDYGARQ